MAHRIFTTSFASIYPLYVTKAERKGRTKAEVDQVIGWLTGYDHDGLARVLADETDVQTFFDQAPAFNPNASLIKGVICGHRVEEIDDPLMQKVRYLDKLIDAGQYISDFLQRPSNSRVAKALLTKRAG